MSYKFIVAKDDQMKNTCEHCCFEFKSMACYKHDCCSSERQDGKDGYYIKVPDQVCPTCGQKVEVIND